MFRMRDSIKLNVVDIFECFDRGRLERSSLINVKRSQRLEIDVNHLHLTAGLDHLKERGFHNPTRRRVVAARGQLWRHRAELRRCPASEC